MKRFRFLDGEGVEWHDGTVTVRFRNAIGWLNYETVAMFVEAHRYAIEWLDATGDTQPSPPPEGPLPSVRIAELVEERVRAIHPGPICHATIAAVVDYLDERHEQERRG